MPSGIQVVTERLQFGEQIAEMRRRGVQTFLIGRRSCALTTRVVPWRRCFQPTKPSVYASHFSTVVARPGTMSLVSGSGVWDQIQ